MAIAALGHLAARPDLLERLFSLSGMAPGDLAAGAGDPDTLGAILDFVLADEPVLLAFCEDAGLSPETVMRARARLPGAPVWE
ncbi:DUF3572 domain-containing protein [Futiania mangrovi]|uniref:DUF3572 domain-containing protein n=1 Tax=Futiania mangrovi TaxID=2959716 RepID=A0A9J6PAX3_9PROT|nr:DUF3572 domain-containing protein [Futiania mangrovii]MCP1335254.1 DUF3572 domain-containing protein [Futiania mangrovii]